MNRFLTIILCSFLAFTAGAQFSLSPKHATRVNQQANAVDKLSLYRKFYTKDSARFAKGRDKYFQSKMDSISDQVGKREKLVLGKGKKVKDGVNTKVYNTIYRPWARRKANEHIEILRQNNLIQSKSAEQRLRIFFEQYYLFISQNDSMLVVLKAQVPSLKLPDQLNSKINDYTILNPLKSKAIQLQSNEMGKAGNLSSTSELTKYKNQLKEYEKYSKGLSNLDSLKGLAGKQGEELAMKYASGFGGYSGDLGQLRKYQTEIDKIKNAPSQYKSQAEQLKDTTYMKEQAKKKAEEKATQYISSHPEIMRGVQQKMNLLLKKYSVIPNSNDLSSATKRSALSGKPIRERLYFATNFQLISIKPVSIDFSPAAGYRFNKNLVSGLGINYRQSFSDSIIQFSPSVFGVKAFASYDLVKNFFAYGELDRNSPGIQRQEQGPSKRIWKNAAFLGIGHTSKIFPKFEMTMIVMYNLLYTQHDPIYPKRWNIKVGIQTSALAFFKPKKTFN